MHVVYVEYVVCVVYMLCSVYLACIIIIRVQGVHNSPPLEKCQYYRRGQVNFKILSVALARVIIFRYSHSHKTTNNGV